MILPILFISIQFRTAQVQPEQRTIPIVSDEHGILSLGEPFEQNETTQEQTPNDKLQPMDELPLSAHFHQEIMELPPFHMYLPQAIKVSLTNQNIESLSNELSQKVYTLMGRAHQQEVPPTLSQETVVMETSIEPADTDLETLLAYGDLGPLSVDDINVEPLSSDTDMEIFSNDTHQFEDALMTDAKRQANLSDLFAHLETSATFSDSSSKEARKFGEIRDRNKACSTSSGSTCGQSFGSVRSISGENFAQSGNTKHLTVNCTSQKKFQCDICAKQFSNSRNCQRHRRIHTGEKPFQCEICLQKFRTSSNYQSHRRIHTKEKPFQCDICAKQFSASNNYQRHRRTHTREKPFKCDFCLKGFIDCGSYERHRRIHTGEKPFQCDICQKLFRTSTSYRTHRRTHTGEKPFKCELCSQQFRSLGNYRSHRRTHTGEKPFQCDICGKQFSVSSNCQRHRRTHTGEKPFKCDFCQKEFSDCTTCLRHRRTHTGEKPYQCDICRKQFRTSTHYRRHRKTHGGWSS